MDERDKNILKMAFGIQQVIANQVIKNNLPSYDAQRALIVANELSELQAENKQLRKIIVREVDDGRAAVDDIGIDAWIEQALKLEKQPEPTPPKGSTMWEHLH